MEYRTNPIRAIRDKCLDCSGGQYKEVEHCPITKCPLWPFRMGKNPYHSKASDEVRRRSGINADSKNQGLE